MLQSEEIAKPYKVKTIPPKRTITEIFCYIVCFVLAIPSSTEVLILAPLSSITCGRDQGTICGAGDLTWLSYVQGKCCTRCIISLDLFCVSFESLL